MQPFRLSGFQVQVDLMRPDHRPAERQFAFASSGHDGARFVQPIMNADKPVARGFKSRGVFAAQGEICEMVPPLAVFSDVKNRVPLGLDLADGKIPLKIRQVVLPSRGTIPGIRTS